MAKPPGSSNAAGKEPSNEQAQDFEQDKASRRMTLDLEELRLTDQPREPLTKEEFVSLCKSKPDELFEGLIDHLSKLESRVQEAESSRDDAGTDDVEFLEKENTDLKKQLKEHRLAMAELIEERDNARTQGSATGKKKSSKLRDGKPLNDGKDPLFESWLIDVETKLAENADHYPTARSRMHYVKSMCEGDAAEHLLPRFRNDSPYRYCDVQDIFDHLKTLYMDENRVVNAKMKLRRLVMREMKFQTFLSQFTLLAQESRLSQEE
ncbi:hypothetical protein EYB25_009375 [Talaromyces marneffei]|nr:hypothetical protein EYB25_009375 [Talaromyces marneffei]